MKDLVKRIKKMYPGSRAVTDFLVSIADEQGDQFITWWNSKLGPQPSDLELLQLDLNTKTEVEIKEQGEIDLMDQALKDERTPEWARILLKRELNRK